MKNYLALALLAFPLFAGATTYTLDLSSATPANASAPVLRHSSRPLDGLSDVRPALQVGDTIHLTLFPDTSFALEIVSAPPAGIAGQSFIARDQSSSASAVVKVTKSGIRISIDDFMRSLQYTVRCKDGLIDVFERDNSQVDAGECGTCQGSVDAPIPEPAETTEAAPLTRRLLTASTDPTSFPVATQKSVVDILVAFDQGAVAKSSELGYDTIEGFADYAVNKMNLVLANSKLDNQFCYRLVGVTEIDGTWTAVTDTLLFSLRAREGKFAKLDQLRDKYGADTITLLINRTSGNTSGIGFEYSGNAGKTLEYFENMKYGCNVCDINTVHSRYTMSHETGHNMGCGHSNRQGSNSGPGRYSDSCGYHFTDANNVKRSTVMAYTYYGNRGENNDYYDPIPYFSTPNISPAEYGCALGVEGVNNNRGTLLQTHADIASLHEHVKPYAWDLRVLENGRELIEGDYCDVIRSGYYHSFTLTHDNPNATIYYTLDGSEPNANSDSVANGGQIQQVYLYDTEVTLKVCAVVDGVAQSKRTITLKEGDEWSGTENGNGILTANNENVLSWCRGTMPFYKYATLVFLDNTNNVSPVITVMGEVAPYATVFSAERTAYTFNKGDDTALIKFRDASFAPDGNVTFNLPVQLDKNVTSFTVMPWRNLTFNAPFGQTLDSSSGSCTNVVTISKYGTLTVAPGNEKTQTLNTLNTSADSTSTFRVGEGTVKFTGAIDGGKGVIGRTKLEVGNGGNLVFDVPGGGGTGYNMDQASLTVENGGKVTYTDMELLKRTLYLDGGTIYAKRLDLMSNPGIYVTDNSAIADNNGGYIYLRGSSSEINVSSGKTLTLGIGTDQRSDTSGNALIKCGDGTIAANAELKHNGATNIKEGTLEVGYSSGSTVYGQGWIVADCATLKIKNGCSLKVPSLTLDPGATIVLPSAGSAPLVVTDAVDLTGVNIFLEGATSLSEGSSYPIISSSGSISGTPEMDGMPALASGLEWAVETESGTLRAKVVTAGEKPTIDILVAFDKGAQAYVTNKGITLKEFAQTQIDLMNEVLITNKLDRYYSYTLAGICKVDAVYNNINTAPALIAAGEGSAVSLRAAREIYGADTVTLLVDTTGATIGNSSPLNSKDNVASQHECAFSVCSIRAVDTGKQHTMIHENAHNMGCGHARAQHIINSPFDYGRGYYFQDGNITRHTIMAYGGDNDASWYFSTTSKAFGYKLGDATNNNARVLKETCGDVAQWRTGSAIPLEGVEVDGIDFETSVRYPWRVDSDGYVRSYNQTDYTNQCTTPLKATITGPKRLSFQHKSYFGGESVAGSNYSHFDVLLDDSPVLTQTECTNSWTEASVYIPEGSHEVSFVFSQRFAMNNSKDYKGGTPEADDAVWIKDIALAGVPAHSSTSDEVSWTFPQDATKVPESYVDGLVLGETGITQTLDFGSTNAVVASILCELPDKAEGALIGFVDANGSSEHKVYAYANGDGTFIIYYDNKAKTDSSVKSGVLDVSGIHLWTLAYETKNGAKLYLDGTEVASDSGIKWTGNNNLHLVSKSVSFGSDTVGTYPISGMKVFAVDTDFGPDNSSASSTAFSAARVFTSFDFLADYSYLSADMQLELFGLYKTTGVIEPDVTHACVLRISEIMPKPTDDRTLNGREGMDVNGLESGWVEVENTSPAKWADLADYRFIRTNRGKKTNIEEPGNLPSRLVPPHSRTIFYTSERYPNSDTPEESAFQNVVAKDDRVKPVRYPKYGNIIVYGKKVNPKKSPFVRLYYIPNTDTATTNVVDTVVIPSDLPEGWSIIVGNAKDDEGTRRWMCPTPTRNAANSNTDDLTRIGPNVGPLYEKKGQQKTDLANEFASTVPPAKPGEDYIITLPINPVMNPDGSFVPREKDKIKSLKLVYRKNLDDKTLVTNTIEMATKTIDKNWGDQYTATIPFNYFPERGHLIQWKVLIEDQEGVTWTSPSFNNKDDGYEWYGTIVEPDEDTQMSATLPTWHMFAAEPHLTQMDKDKDGQNKSAVPNYARIAIYDSSTSNYYDYVRIDLRGNTSKDFTKKSHGLRFAKAHPLTMTDIVSGKEIKEIRKTSLISEYADPSYMRQMIAFWLWNKMGNKVPFDFPVRCNLNGEFYQLAFNSERFTDELIEDVYKLDKYGYSYKNVGTLNKLTTAGGAEKKTPDDENETDLSVLRSNLEEPLIARGANQSHDTKGNKDLTKFVVEKFDLPAWINYLASARITQEMDDVWANVCAYYDNPTMKEGERGTGTWMPLGYDFNLSFGQWHYADLNGERFGLMSNQDSFKSHPLYGGWTILTGENGNNGFEAIYQSPKFRRLYLRRLRTLMDQELKEPGTAEGATPFMLKMRKLAGLMRADAARDIEKWPNDDTDNKIQVWTDDARPADMDAGINDIWNNYVVPRREHLYVTHSITNTDFDVGYAADKNAGIPEAQSPFKNLISQITVNTDNLADGVVVITNGNNEVVDMSGWTLNTGKKGVYTLPAGTVCDANDCIYVVSDRRQYIADHIDKLTDQVIIGNATFGDASSSSITVPEVEDTASEGVSGDDVEVIIPVTNEEDAQKWAAGTPAAVTKEQADAGLDPKYLKVEAKSVTTESGTYYQAVVVLNEDAFEEKEKKPEVDTEKPVSIEEDEKGKKLSATISNAVQGLWYGYAVSESLGNSNDYKNDVDSFARATEKSITIKSSAREPTKEREFFIVRGLLTKPTE